MKLYLSLFLVLVLFIASSCNTSTDDPDPKKTIELDEKSAELVAADNTFGLNLFQTIREEIHKTSQEENIMISPLSVSLALAMAYNGADNNTKLEMENVMQLNGLTSEQINNSYKSLISALQSLDEDVVFEIANAIYYADGFPIKQPFLDINSDFYNAEVNALDFGNTAQVLNTINGWVADKTHDKIKTIINDLSEDARLVLLNAIYFFGNWTIEFDEDGTKMRSFYYADGTSGEVETMHKEDELAYTENELFSAVKLPYGNGQYNMVVMLPGEGKNSVNVINELNAANWNSWNNQFETRENVVVTMPRFKFEFKSNLNDMLKSMGMLDAFSPTNADFSKISDVDLFISTVVHKTYIDVNETGTEAAAVTAIIFETTSAGGPVEEKTYFRVNKPFVFAITEKDTDAILFIGEVQNPKYEE
ncbi:serpin family protein [uncultured Draconibacterium sp.]|uniref:serpin family protein n=1 Tax=uncultured Draconibacterium sp. TaxID=1573823 RepID=UPI002AA80B03|nr:serpin family protein [uncultured Draconibacterium sp.]